MRFDFPADAEGVLQGAEVAQWDQAELRLFVSSNRALRGEARLSAGNQDFALEPLDRRDGIYAPIGDPRGLGQFEMRVGINGARSVSAAAVGRASTISIESDWPHPSFYGSFLPNESEITDTGFSARWAIPHLARALPQISREDPDESARDDASMGARFFQPNDFYQKAYRSARYGILFIALTFLTVLLMDRTNAKPAHPVQYLLIGLAQAIFVLLMVADSEQIGFGAAYALSAGATILLLVMFAATGLKMGRRAWVLALLLVVLYGVLYLILESTDYALLAGASLAFVALAGTMYWTRNEDWYGAPRDGLPLWQGWGRPNAQPQAPSPTPETPTNPQQQSDKEA
ncbi:Inner membrane protein CreD-like protein [Candidatus Rhodobacter oscarellae]|uniref:Inner membrane protein CreD-like protein n=1 Tax=Candidatus Rhodobacter oscarellae TaxID=1675527 RepID=A0A0J9E9J3_9RHOB|nr:Inner membrane protein CreD-like protein [Candidatus Rhodobacter lobularis]